MSRFYEMTVEISGHDPEKEAAIQAAATKEWPFDDWICSEGNMRASAQDSLCGGETEEEFAERLSIAIWHANGYFCEVIVNATYLENQPYEIHSLDEDDYERLIGKIKR
jgi:hypothetical protein